MKSPNFYALGQLIRVLLISSTDRSHGLFEVEVQPHDGPALRELGALRDDHVLAPSPGVLHSSEI